MWCNHPFSQRNMKTERTVEMRVGGDREVGGGQNLEKGAGRVGRQYRRGGGGLPKIRGLTPLCQLFKETLKNSHSSIIKPTPLFLVFPHS